MPGLAVFSLALAILACIYWVEGYPSGAPASTCFTRYPKHKGQGTETTPCPIRITFSSPSYTLGGEVIVTVEDPNPNKRWFAGIQMAAFRDSGNQEEIVGQFISYPTEKLKTLTCFGGFQNMITHKKRSKVQNLKITWKAPTDHVGNVTFKATIVANFETFWTDVKASLPSANQDIATIKSPLHKAVDLKLFVQDVDFSGCGENKGCFLHPRHCTGENCIAAVGYQYRQVTDDYLFEMYTTAAANWISLGFSHDQLMSQDETISCVANSGIISVQHGLNPLYYNERLLTRFLSDVEIRQSDGRLQCRFVLPKVSSAYIINQTSNVLDYTNVTFNKEQDWHLMLAWGKAMPASNVLAKHVVMPPVTCSKVNLKEVAVHRGTSFPALVRVHGALMIIAWIFFGGIITVVSRHYRGWLPKVTLLGTKVWFQVHRELAILVLILTITGIIAIFAQYGAIIRQFAIPHAYVGLAVVAAVSIQALAGALRPGIDHKMRYLFNWGHRFLGQITHILAAVTMFLAFDIQYFSKEQKIFGVAVLSVWVAVQLMWHIAFEILACEGLPLGSSKDSSRKDDDKSSLLTILFIVYVITLAGLCTAALLAFLLF
ncbi:hypothetical protein BsWGS_04496 [Bradybaena similaris]